VYIVVVREQKGAVYKVYIKPEIGDQVDPVQNTLEKIDLVRGHYVFDEKFKSEPRDAHIFNVVKNRRHWLTTAN